MLTAIWPTTKLLRSTVRVRNFAARAARATTRGVCSAGNRPESAPQSSDSKIVNSAMRRSRPARSRNGTPVGARSTKTRSSPSASAIPAAAPASESRAASVSVCRIKRPRLAPSAERTANSRSRPSPRTIIRLATFAQAISSTANTEPSSIHAIDCASCVSRSRSERMLKWKSLRISAGTNESLVWSKSGSISALACSMLTPGLRRANVRIGLP